MSASEEAPTLKFGLQRLDDITGGLQREGTRHRRRPSRHGQNCVRRPRGAHAPQSRAARSRSSRWKWRPPPSRCASSRRKPSHTARSLAYAELRRGRLPEAHTHALFEAEARLRDLPLYIHEGRQLTPSGLLLAAKRAQKEFRDTKTPLGLVIVDHIQKIRPDRDCRGNKVAEMTEISDALQKMAGTLNLPVIALSQLNRAVESREGRRPELADLRESGAIEQDADLVLLLYREAYYAQKAEPHRHHDDWPEWHADYVAVRDNLDIHIAKHRNGREGQVRAHFDAPSSGMK